MEPISIFVTVGTNHYNFSRMLTLVDECLSLLDKPYSLTLQYGASTLVKQYEGSVCVEMLPREEAERAYETSDLVFSHCGIGSIYNSLSYNRPTVIIPRREKHNEFSDDHQLQIAREISNNPMVHMIEDEVNAELFLDFISNNLSKPKMKIDLTNHHLSRFIKSRLLA
jgi:UDP-N-acetylglucosamine transferase subunit ALG13